MLKDINWDWEIVPHALEIPGHVIFEMKYDNKGIRNQIFALLRYWRDSNPENSKEKLVVCLCRADARLHSCNHLLNTQNIKTGRNEDCKRGSENEIRSLPSLQSCESTALRG